ncbi:MAG: hypothetical protein Q9217_006086 [Psora testacea]
MAEAPQTFTLDGQPPNGGIPPGLLFMGIPNAPNEPSNDGIPPAIATPSYSPVQTDAVGGSSQAALMPNTNAQNLRTQPASPNILSLPSLPVLPLLAQLLSIPINTMSSQRDNPTYQLSNAAPKIYAPDSTHNHTHFHIHEASPSNDVMSASNNGAALAAPAEENVHIHWVNNGARPCDSYPYPCPNVQYSRHTVPKSMTIRELMVFLGCPQQRGYGLQQVFRMEEDDVYGPGKHWEYGVGDQNMKLGECEIGRGIVGIETVLEEFEFGIGEISHDEDRLHLPKGAK